MIAVLRDKQDGTTAVSFHQNDGIPAHRMDVFDSIDDALNVHRLDWQDPDDDADNDVIKIATV